MASMNSNKHSRHNPARKHDRRVSRDSRRHWRRSDKQASRKARRSHDPRRAI